MSRFDGTCAHLSRQLQISDDSLYFLFLYTGATAVNHGMFTLVNEVHVSFRKRSHAYKNGKAEFLE